MPEQSGPAPAGAYEEPTSASYGGVPMAATWERNADEMLQQQRKEAAQSAVEPG